MTALSAVVEIADERAPLEDGGGYAWSVRYGTMRDVTGMAQTPELAAKAIGCALAHEISVQGVWAYYADCSARGVDSGD